MCSLDKLGWKITRVTVHKFISLNASKSFWSRQLLLPRPYGRSIAVWLMAAMKYRPARLNQTYALEPHAQALVRDNFDFFLDILKESVESNSWWRFRDRSVRDSMTSGLDILV